MQTHRDTGHTGTVTGYNFFDKIPALKSINRVFYSRQPKILFYVSFFPVRIKYGKK